MVSIIIPCYNAAGLLSETLDSVLQQTYRDWECLVIDDGSTDNSKDVVQSYINKDSRFKYFHQNNSGPSAARNLGIKLSAGGLLQFIDSDDLIEKEKLRIQVQVFTDFPAVDMVYGDMKYFTRTSDGQIKVKANTDEYWRNGKISGRGDKIIPVLLSGNIMVVDSPLIKRTVFDKIGLWDPEIWFNEDWDVWTRAALSGLSFKFDNTVGTDSLVRDHEDSRSRDTFKMFLHGLKVCLKINKVIKQREYKKIMKPKIYYHFQFLEKDILALYKTDKTRSLAKSTELYDETNLFHYYIFAWLIHHMPYYLCLKYSQLTYLFNRLKCKLLYES
jgi:glycosyltransferase involved in cell wall biosynthesis